MRLPVAVLTAVVVTAAGLTVAAVPARAASTIVLTAGNGTVGTTQTLSATVGSDSVLGFTPGVVTFTAGTQEVGTVRVTQVGAAAASWVPTTAGSIVVTSEFVPDSTVGGATSATDSQTVAIASVGTTTNVTSPDTVQVGSTFTVTATVTSRGSYVPTGSVTFYFSSGTVIAAIPLEASARAVLSYQAPATAQTLRFYAKYSGDSNASASTSNNDSVRVATTSSVLTLSAPTTNYVNVPSTLIAKVSTAGARGTITFTVGGTVIGVQPLNAGQALQTWTPTSLGNLPITATYNDQGGNQVARATNSVQVANASQKDQIVVDPQGSAAPWIPGGSTSLVNGASVTLGVTAASRNPVSLGMIGSGCSLSSGLALKALAGTGTCTVTARTKGGNGFAPTTQSYTVVLAPGRQQVSVKAPPSGAVARGSVFRIGRQAQRSDVGQPVTFRITRGEGLRCVLKYTARGNVYVKAKQRRGTCAVRFTARAIPGQWLRFQALRTYSIR